MKRLSKQHCRCTSKKACGRRCKGFAGEPCPSCGAPLRLDIWGQARARHRTDLCYCDGPHWSIKAPHRFGSGGCKYQQECEVTP